MLEGIEVKWIKMEVGDVEGGKMGGRRGVEGGLEA